MDTVTAEELMRRIYRVRLRVDPRATTVSANHCPPLAQGTAIKNKNKSLFRCVSQ